MNILYPILISLLLTYPISAETTDATSEIPFSFSNGSVTMAAMVALKSAEKNKIYAANDDNPEKYLKMQDGITPLYGYDADYTMRCVLIRGKNAPPEMIFDEVVERVGSVGEPAQEIVAAWFMDACIVRDDLVAICVVSNRRMHLRFYIKQQGAWALRGDPVFLKTQNEGTLSVGAHLRVEGNQVICEFNPKWRNADARVPIPE